MPETTIGAEVSYPTDTELSTLYSKIEADAIAVIESGNAVGNPFVRKGYRDSRYCISADAPIHGSSASLFLDQAIQQISASDPSFKTIPTEFLYLTLTEVIHSDEGRKHAGITATKTVEYYDALRNNYPDSQPIHLPLLKIMPTPDRPPDPENPEKRSIAVVGAFLTGGNEAIFKTRKMVGEAVMKSGLEFIERPGVGFLRVIFVTLGRFIEPPMVNGKAIPFLETIRALNDDLPLGYTALINQILVDSNTTLNYFDPRGYVFIEPAINFQQSKRFQGTPRFLRPAQLKFSNKHNE